jgi:hypothetical protein
MKHYRLLKELAGIPAGAIFELNDVEMGQAYFLCKPHEVCLRFGTVALSIPMVENQPDWFQLQDIDL